MTALLPSLHRAILAAATLTFSALYTRAADTPAPASKPNIILILSDDVGLPDVHCTGGHYSTPNIDALAQTGTRFQYCYATPLCGPSRCQLLTSRYPFRTGLINNNSHQAIQPEREIMIPTMLKKAGYVTGSVGKWGQMSHGPGEWGFDEYLVFPGSGRYWRAQTPTYRVNGAVKDLPANTYLPNIMHQFIVDFIAHHKDQPFFLYYPMSHIHGPIVRTPDSKPGSSPEQLYADNVQYMDKLVGQLVEEVDRQHLREKTLILFTGDNGTAHFGVAQGTVDGKPISGQKATMKEGGSRVPLIANWPGTTPAGQVCHDLTDFSDFFPTVAELAGASMPPGVTTDGHSFAPEILGHTATPRQWIYVELNGKRYVANQRWKLNNSGELFDLKNAPFAEQLIPPDTADPDAIAARKSLLATLENLVGPDRATKVDDGPSLQALKANRRRAK
jgi:arylsulfatase A